MNRISIILSVIICFINGQNSSITIKGTGTPGSSAHITVTTDGYKCPAEFIVESGASLTTWDPAAICGASTSGSGDIALPVELTSYTAMSVLNGVKLKWITESEIENLGFIIERKTDDVEWSEITSYKTDNALIGQGTTSFPTEYEYLDTFIEPNSTYKYRLADVDYTGNVTYHSSLSVTVDKAPLPAVVEKFTVLPSYPNPFNPITTITYGLDQDSDVTIQIYDINGRLVKNVLNTIKKQGWHSVQWNGTDNTNKSVPNGQYFLKIISGDKQKTQKLLFLK